MSARQTLLDRIEGEQNMLAGREFWAKQTKGSERRRWLRLATRTRAKLVELKAQLKRKP